MFIHTSQIKGESPYTSQYREETFFGVVILPIIRDCLSIKDLYQNLKIRRELNTIFKSTIWPQIRQDHPLNLSILISGGKETNKDSLSNGEWSGNSSNLKSPGATLANCSLEKRFLSQDTVQVLWNETSERVRIPYLAVGLLRLYGASSKSRVVWECSPKWVVNFI